MYVNEKYNIILKNKDGKILFISFIHVESVNNWIDNYKKNYKEFEDCTDKIMFFYRNGILDIEKSIKLCSVYFNFECDVKTIQDLNRIYKTMFD